MKSNYLIRGLPVVRPDVKTGTVMNNAGGRGFAVDKWQSLRRFLILGTEGGTFYVNEDRLTKDNARAVSACIAEDGIRVVNEATLVSTLALAPKNDPALFVLAMCYGEGDVKTRSAALDALPQVARIGTHLFTFCEFVDKYKGWGRALRRAIGDWYGQKAVKDATYQVVKYGQRNGWTHRDVLRLAHPNYRNSSNPAQFQRLYKYAVTGVLEPEAVDPDDALVVAYAAELAKGAESAADIVELIGRYSLPREVIPTEFLNDPEVWEALLVGMPMTALVRNLGKVTSLGLMGPDSMWAAQAVERLTDPVALHHARVHPMALFLAARTYASGKGLKGSLTWEPNPDIVKALDEGFYKAFRNVTPSGGHLYIGVDISTSMAWSHVANTSATAYEAALAMALVTARTEANAEVFLFSTTLTEFPISVDDTLESVRKRTWGLRFGGTDCTLLYKAATEAGEGDVTGFVTYTDSEHWADPATPEAHLRAYRERTGLDAKSVLVQMTPTPYSIVDPTQPYNLLVAGFDASAPAAIGEFLRVQK